MGSRCVASVAVRLLARIALASILLIPASRLSAAADLLPLVVYAQPGANADSLWIAEAKGLFKAEGLDVQIRLFPSGTTAFQTFKTGSGINSPPITYTHKGRQYVAVLSGIGGVLNRTMKVADRVPTGGSVWTFALMPE